MADADLLIIGGGPAGSAAAIAAAREGLRVVVLERARAFRGKVGEALHPGVEPLLRGLGAAQALDVAGRLRFEGVRVAWGGPPVLQAFGADDGGAWRGWQVDRDLFDEALLASAAEAGAEVRRGEAPRSAIVHGEASASIQTTSDVVRTRWLIDATGQAGWLCRQLGLRAQVYSKPLRVRYGYNRARVQDPTPALTAHTGGWTWLAPVAPDRVQWAVLSSGGDPPPPPPADGEPIGPPRGADVTWRMVNAVSGPAWFLTGDAAVRLDPASSHGVLRALTSGLFAGQAATAILKGGAPPREAAGAYMRWLQRSARQDLAALSTQYASIGQSIALV